MLAYVTRVKNIIIYSVNGENREVHLANNKAVFNRFSVHMTTYEIETSISSGGVSLAEMVLGIEVVKLLKENKIVQKP